MNATNNTSATESYFNLHVSGVGYLNRIRWVEPSRQAGRRAQPFLACAISAMRGKVGDGEFTYFDLRVSGDEAKAMIGELKQDVDAGRKVVISFRVGDIYPHTYERESRDSSGRSTGQKEWTSLIKGRLLLINSITIDGERVFTRERDDEVPAVLGDAEFDGSPATKGDAREEHLVESDAPAKPVASGSAAAGRSSQQQDDRPRRWAGRAA